MGQIHNIHINHTKQTNSNPLQTSLPLVASNNTSLEVPKGFIYCKEKAATADVANPRQMTSESFANVSSSSNPKRTPPKGLPKATLIPAAAAEASKRLFCANKGEM